LTWLRTGTVGALFEHILEPPGTIKYGYFFTSWWYNSRRIHVHQVIHNLQPSLGIIICVNSRWVVWEGDEIFVLLDGKGHG
jgi:hypothetical protein